MRRIDRFAEGKGLPWTTGYTVRVTNGFTGSLPMVHVRSGRKLHAESLHRLGPLAPGETASAPVGTLGDLGFYEIAAYDDKGHQIAQLPASLGSISPAEAASTLPAREDPHTDDWTLDDTTVLSANEEYTVQVINGTEDTWEAVTVFYGSATEGTVGLESSAVSPTGKATFRLGPAGAMDGYVFAIWVDGLRVELSPGALQFPVQGLMTAQRSAETTGDLVPARDIWMVGDEP